MKRKISDQVANYPERIHHLTKACNAKFNTSNPAKKDIFQLDTFHSVTITADPIIRFEIALREAGLHNTEYVNQAMPCNVYLLSNSNA